MSKPPADSPPEGPRGLMLAWGEAAVPSSPSLGWGRPPHPPAPVPGPEP